MFPPRVVLTAVDFSDPSRTALAFAARLARHCESTLHVVHAIDPVLAAGADTSQIDIVAETRDELGRFMAATLAADGAAVATHAVRGAAVEVVRDIAEREQADVIVLAMHGMSGPERVIFGSTTEGVLRKSNRSVLVVPDSWQPPRPDLLDLAGSGPVVAANDLSLPSLEATRIACRLAAVLGTSVDVVHVVSAPSVLERWSGYSMQAVRQRREAAHAELSAALRHVATTVPVDLTVDVGRVADRLAAAAAARGPNALLVLGRGTQRERGGAPGSTAYRVLTQTAIPVLMYLADD